MMFERSSTVIGGSFLRGIPAGEVDVAAVHLDAPIPFAGRATVNAPVSALRSTANIPTILLLGRGSQVLPSVVGAIEVAVIDLGPVACDPKPDDAMGLVSAPIQHQRNVTAAWSSGWLAHTPTVGGNQPPKKAGSSIVTEQFPQFFNRHGCRKNEISLSGHGASPLTHPLENWRETRCGTEVSGISLSRQARDYARRGPFGNPRDNLVCGVA